MIEEHLKKMENAFEHLMRIKDKLLDIRSLNFKGKHGFGCEYEGQYEGKCNCGFFDDLNKKNSLEKDLKELLDAIP